MGRKLLMLENLSIHPILSFSLLIACMAAIMALISSLCVSRKKSPSPPPPPPKEATTTTTTTTNEAATTTTTTTKTTTETFVEPNNTNDIAAQPPSEDAQLPLPPPPGMPHLRGAASYHFRSTSTSSASGSKLSSSMSMRVQSGLGRMRQHSRREEPSHDKNNRDKKLKHEDSIWKKTIILGEKCRVPDEDDDTVIHDERGNKISTYHPKTPNSLPVSRQTSFIDRDSIPSSIGQK